MIECFFGTMGAGKSTKLLQDRYNYIKKNKEVWVIKPNIDRTKEPKIISKIGLECPAEIMSEINWKDIILRKEFYSGAILIDEIQFFKGCFIFIYLGRTELQVSTLHPNYL